MKISIIIPAYNEENHLGRCLKSVERELAAGDYEAEVIVVNNASTDHTKEIASSFQGVIVVDEPKKGIVRARHAGFAESSGDLIANIDADTELPKGWLKKVMREFERDEKLVALSGPFIYYDLPIRTRAMVRLFYFFGYFFYVFNHYVLRVGAMLQGGNFIVRRSALEQIGGYDTSIAFYGEDTDIARRMSKAGKVKWTFKLPIYASGRRLKHEGVATIGVRYALNYFWIIFLKKPFTEKYKDIRPK